MDGTGSHRTSHTRTQDQGTDSIAPLVRAVLDDEDEVKPRQDRGLELDVLRGHVSAWVNAHVNAVLCCVCVRECGCMNVCVLADTGEVGILKHDAMTTPPIEGRQREYITSQSMRPGMSVGACVCKSACDNSCVTSFVAFESSHRPNTELAAARTEVRELRVVVMPALAMEMVWTQRS